MTTKGRGDGQANASLEGSLGRRSVTRPLFVFGSQFFFGFLGHQSYRSDRAFDEDADQAELLGERCFVGSSPDDERSASKRASSRHRGRDGATGKWRTPVSTDASSRMP